MPTPLVLDCFCNECSQFDSNPNGPEDNRTHSYELYGVIMHLGSSMASGHYVAYTRAPDHHDSYRDCDRDNSKSSTTSDLAKSLNILKFFKPRTTNGNDSSGGPAVCRGKDCCGVRLGRAAIENALNGAVRSSRGSTQLWLECDDDVVRTLSSDEFQALLGCKKNSPATPYLLFYSKMKGGPCGNASSD